MIILLTMTVGNFMMAPSMATGSLMMKIMEFARRMTFSLIPDGLEMTPANFISPDT
jgi:hypothetical protein